MRAGGTYFAEHMLPLNWLDDLSHLSATSGRESGCGLTAPGYAPGNKIMYYIINKSWSVNSGDQRRGFKFSTSV